MQKNGINGRMMLWPGVAEELVATKAYYVRAGMFQDVDANLFAHVGDDFNTTWGPMGHNGLVSRGIYICPASPRMRRAIPGTARARSMRSS